MGAFDSDRPGARFEAGAAAGPFLTDAYVHLHGRFDEDRFLACAAASFAAGAREVGVADGWTGWLPLTEVAGEHRFRDLAERGVGRGGWTVDATVDDAWLIVGRGDAPELVLVAGRQLRARGGSAAARAGRIRGPGARHRGRVRGRAAAHRGGRCGRGAGRGAVGLRQVVVRALAGPLDSIRWSRAGCSSATTATGSACCRRRRCSATRSGGRCGCCRSDPLPLRSEGDKVGRYGFVLDGADSAGGAPGARG